MADITSQGSLHKLNMLGDLIQQSSQPLIQEIVDAIGAEVLQLRQVNADQDTDLTQAKADIVTLTDMLSHLPQMSPEQYQQMVDYVQSNIPEFESITLPTVTWRGEEVTLAEFNGALAMALDKMPIDSTEVSKDAEGRVNSVTFLHDDDSLETVTLSRSEDNGVATYLGAIPNAQGPIDAYEVRFAIESYSSAVFALTKSADSDHVGSRFVGTSFKINFGTVVIEALATIVDGTGYVLKPGGLDFTSVASDNGEGNRSQWSISLTEAGYYNVSVSGLSVNESTRVRFNDELVQDFDASVTGVVEFTVHATAPGVLLVHNFAGGVAFSATIREVEESATNPEDLDV